MPIIEMEQERRSILGVLAEQFVADCLTAPGCYENFICRSYACPPPPAIMEEFSVITGCEPELQCERGLYIKKVASLNCC